MVRFNTPHAVVVILTLFVIALMLTGCDAEDITKGVSYCCPIAPLPFGLAGLAMIAGWKKKS